MRGPTPHATPSCRRVHTAPMPARAGRLLGTTALLTMLLALFAVTATAQSNHVRTRHVKATLLSELSTVVPNKSFWVGLRLEIRPGWHTYWLNPGDSGLATSIDWELPDGIAAGAIRWPIPSRFPVGHLMNYGYSDEVVLLTRMSAWPAINAAPRARMVAKAQWLVCEEVCIIEQGQFELSLPVTTGAPELDSEARALIEEYARQLPAPAQASARFFTNGDTIRLRVPLPNDWPRNAGEAWFFPNDFGVIDHSARQQAKPYAEGLELTLMSGDLGDQRMERLRGVLVLGYDNNDRRGLSVNAQPQ